MASYFFFHFFFHFIFDFYFLQLYGSSVCRESERILCYYFFIVSGWKCLSLDVVCVSIERCCFLLFVDCHHHHYLSLNREGRLGTTDDFTIIFSLSISPCSPLPSGIWQTPGLSIPWCCLSTSSFVRVVFFPFSLCLARWFWPDLMNGKHDHTTAVCVSLRWSEGLRVVRLPAGT